MLNPLRISYRVAAVTKGIIELIEDDCKLGDVLVVCVKKGTKYKHFSDN